MFSAATPRTPDARWRTSSASYRQAGLDNALGTASEPILDPGRHDVRTIRRERAEEAGSMVDTADNRPLRIFGQREGDLDQKVVQPLRGPFLPFERRNLRGIRNALADCKGRVEVRVPRECDPAPDHESVQLPVVLFSEVLRDLTLHFEPNVLAEPEELPAQRGDADIRLLVVGREGQDLGQMVRAEHPGVQGDRPLQLLGFLPTAYILGWRGLFEPGLGPRRETTANRRTARSGRRTWMQPRVRWPCSRRHACRPGLQLEPASAYG